MLIPHLKKALCVVAITIISLPSYASTYYYEFDKNISSFTNPFTPKSESLMTPYASMSVFDEAEGVGISLKVNQNYLGALAKIYLRYIPELAQVPVKNTAQLPTINETSAYYYSDNNVLYGNGYSLNSEGNIAIFFAVSHASSVSNNITFHFRNLTSNLNASTFSPLYLLVEDAYGWGKFNDDAYVLASEISGPIASQVPENTSSGQLLLGLLMLMLIRNKRVELSTMPTR